MALAHLASLDMTSVDREDSSSGEEDEERKKKSQQSPSATGRGQYAIYIYYWHFTQSVIPYTFKFPFLSDPREESQPLRDQCAQLDSLTETADLSLHRSDAEEEKGE